VRSTTRFGVQYLKAVLGPATADEFAPDFEAFLAAVSAA
jgi:hypothetical protein